MLYFYNIFYILVAKLNIFTYICYGITKIIIYELPESK